MTRPVSRLSIIGTIVRKDLKEYGRDRLWAFLTVLVLVAVIALFWVLPDEVNESIIVGLSGVDDTAVEAALGGDEQGLKVVPFGAAAELRAVVAGESDVFVADGSTVVIPHDSGAAAPEGAEKADVGIGIAFPPDFFTATAAGEETTVEVFVDAAIPDEVEAAIAGVVSELAFEVAGDSLPVEAPREVYTVLGEDRAGNQVSARESFRPVFVFLILLMEMFVMSSLIAKEIQDRTVTAMLITPAKMSDVLAAKSIAGALSGLVQAVIILVAINALRTEPVLILTLIALGAVMVAGTSMIAGSAGKDFMGTLFYGMVFMIPLLIPAFSALFPGTASVWIRAIPSYPLVEGLVNVTSYGAGWADTLPQLGVLAAWCVGLFAVGWMVLKRRVESI